MMQSGDSTKSTQPPRRWLTIGAATLLVVYWLLLITATHIPKVPHPLGLRPSDKLLHLTAYAILGWLVGMVWALRWKFTWRVAAVLLLAIAVHGALDEVTQPLFGRYADVADWYADVAGGAIGLAAVGLAGAGVRALRKSPAIGAAEQRAG